jgi:hypothetical protein
MWTRAAVLLLVSLAPAVAASNGMGWEVYADAAGTRVNIPADLFRVLAGPAEAGKGDHYATADGQSHLSIYVVSTGGLSPSEYLRRHMPEAPSKLDYYRVTRSFFVVSKYSGDKVLYRRCNFERTASLMHCIDLSYPAAAERDWDAIVTRISRSLRPLTS